MPKLTHEMSTGQVAYMFGVKPKTVIEWDKGKAKLARGERPHGWLHPAKLPNGKYDPAKVHELYMEHKILPQYSKPDDGAESLDEAKRRKEIAVANMKELEERQLRGDLIERDEAVKWVGGLVAEAKAAFLALPRRSAPVVYGQEVRDIEVMLRKEINSVLEKLSRPLKEKKVAAASNDS